MPLITCRFLSVMFRNTFGPGSSTVNVGKFGLFYGQHQNNISSQADTQLVLFRKSVDNRKQIHQSKTPLDI